MIPLKNRIKHKKDFEVACRYGKSVFCDKMVLKFIKNGLDLSRIGLSVGLGFSRSAVKRNRLKRQLRVFFGEKLIQIRPGFDFVLIVRKGFGCEKAETRACLEDVLTKTGLINKLSTSKD